ncbi:hypothetical protein ACO1O0_003416 [Amphichorda felina]
MVSDISSGGTRPKRRHTISHPVIHSRGQTESSPTTRKLFAADIVRQLTADPLFRNNYFEIRRSAVAGLGAVATRQLSQGDIILVEEPLFVSDDFRLFECFEALDTDAQRVALSLHRNELLKTETSEIKAVWSTNRYNP